MILVQNRVCVRRNSFIRFNSGNKCIDSYLLTQEPRIRVLTPKRNIFISGFDFNPNPSPYISCCRIYLLQFFQALESSSNSSSPFLKVMPCAMIL